MDLSCSWVSEKNGTKDVDVTKEYPLFAFISTPLCTSSSLHVLASSVLQFTW